jgi:hypothetical protein
MKKTMTKIAALALSASALVLAACAEPASEDEITQMCQQFGNLSAGADTPEALRRKVAAIEEEHAAKVKALEEEAKAAAAKLDAEEQAALDEFKPQDAENRTAVVNEFGKKRSDATQASDAKIKQASLDRDELAKKAKEAADAAEAAWNEVVFKCQADHKGAAKPVATCRIGAASKDAWEKCE